jgi:pimeloyl-ACP methyl ester carboxylesterase
MRALASFSRLILFDKRGTGLSDPVPNVPTLEERMEDLHAVLDAAGSERPALLGISEGGPMSISFAATYPERVSSLIIYGSSPRFSRSRCFLPERREFFERVRRDTRSLVEHWGEARSPELFWPSVAGDQAGSRKLVGVAGRQSLTLLTPRSAFGTLFPSRAVHAANDVPGGWTTVDATGRVSANAEGQGRLRKERSPLHRV